MYHFIPRHIGGFDDQFGSVWFDLYSQMLVSKFIPVKRKALKQYLKPTIRYVSDQRPNTLYLLTYFKIVHLRKIIIRLYTHVIILLKGPGRLSRLPTTKSTLGTNKWSIFIKVVLYKYHLYDRSRSYRVWFRGVPSMFWLDTFLMFWYNR